MAAVIEQYAVRTRGIGLPDYAQPKPAGAVPVGPVYTSTDTAELAARLGSPITFDRRGNVYWLDDFESGVDKWECFDGTLSWSSAKSRNGGFSARILSAAPPADGSMTVRLPLPAMGKFGFEYSFNLPDAVAANRTINIGIVYHTPDYMLRGSLRWVSNVLWAVPWGGPAAIRVNPNLELAIWDKIFYNWKLVLDFPNMHFLRAIFNGQQYDLSALPLVSEPPIVGYDFSFLLANIWTNNDAYADDAIVTVNEPDNI